MSLGLILLGAAVLYLAGLKYGLPYVFQPDEPITVRRALRFGSGDLNPHFFYYPSLLMYLYFLLYGIYYLLGHLAGFFPDVQSFAHAFISDPSVFYLIGRAVSALSLLGGLVVLYRCGEKWGGEGAGLWAVLSLAFLPQVIEYAHWAKADAPLLGLSTLCLALLYSLAHEGRWRDYLLSGCLLGFALGLKYNALLLLPGLPLAHFLFCRERKEGWRCLGSPRLWVAALVIPAAFLVTTPFALLDWPAFRHDFIEQVTINVVGLENLRAGWRDLLGAVLGWGGSKPLGVLGVLALAWALARRNGAALLPAGLCMLGVLAISRQGLIESRYLFPVYPAWALLIGMGAADLARLFRSPFLRAVAPAAVVLSTALTLPVSLATAGKFTRQDTRVAARSWVEANLPTGAKVAVDSHGPPLEMTREALEGLYRQTLASGHIKSDYYRLKLETYEGPGFDWYLTRQTLLLTPPHLAEYSQQAQRLFPIGEGYDELIRRGFQYAVVSDWNYNDYLGPGRKELFPGEAGFYLELFRRGRLLKEFSPRDPGFAGPGISVYQTAED